jgi:fumarate hydratase, class I
VALEAEVHQVTQQLGVGAQFGGKYFCQDVRIIHLPRQGASLPIGLGVSGSADRQALAKITKDGLFLEQLEQNPAQFLPDTDDSQFERGVVHVDLPPDARHSRRATPPDSHPRFPVRADDRGARRARQ